MNGREVILSIFEDKPTKLLLVVFVVNLSDQHDHILFAVTSWSVSYTRLFAAIMFYVVVDFTYILKSLEQI